MTLYLFRYTTKVSAVISGEFDFERIHFFLVLNYEHFFEHDQPHTSAHVHTWYFAVLENFINISASFCHLRDQSFDTRLKCQM